jgi:hypothetical protein
MKRLNNCSYRKAHGGVLVEGVVGISLITAFTVAAVILLFDVGMTMYYKQKIGFIANVAANQACQGISFAGSFNPAKSDAVLTNEARTLINRLLSQSGLSRSTIGNLSVRQDLATQTVTVDLTINNLPLFPNATLLPSILPGIQERTSASMAVNFPPAMASLQCIAGDNNTMIAFPCYGKFVAPFSNGAAPATGAPPGTALFLNRAPGSFGQFSISIPNSPGNGFSQTLPTQ